MWISRGLSLIVLGLQIWSSSTTSTSTISNTSSAAADGSRKGPAASTIVAQPVSGIVQGSRGRRAESLQAASHEREASEVSIWLDPASRDPLHQRDAACPLLPGRICPGYNETDGYACGGCSTCCLDGIGGHQCCGLDFKCCLSSNGTGSCCPKDTLARRQLSPDQVTITTTATVFANVATPAPTITTFLISTITQTITLTDLTRGIETSIVTITSCATRIRREVLSAPALPPPRRQQFLTTGRSDIDAKPRRQVGANQQRPVITFTITINLPTTPSTTVTVTRTRFNTVFVTLTVAPSATTTVVSLTTTCPPGLITPPTISVPPSLPTTTATPLPGSNKTSTRVPSTTTTPGQTSTLRTTTAPGTPTSTAALPLPSSSTPGLTSDQIAIIAVGVILAVAILVVTAILLRFFLAKRRRTRLEDGSNSTSSPGPRPAVSGVPLLAPAPPPRNRRNGGATTRRNNGSGVDEDDEDDDEGHSVRIVVRPAPSSSSLLARRRREEEEEAENRRRVPPRVWPAPPGHRGERYTFYVDPNTTMTTEGGYNTTSASGGVGLTREALAGGGSNVAGPSTAAPPRDEQDSWSIESTLSSPGPSARDSGRRRTYGATWFGGGGVGRAY